MAFLALACLCLAARHAGATSGASADSSAAPIVRHGSVTQEPGYYPPNDPESASVRIGRRLNAPRVSRPFRGGARSLEALGRKVCHVLLLDNRDSMMVLTVREDEFRDILWPEFPQSRPITGITWEDAWRVLSARLHGGAGFATQEFGRHRYQFLRFEQRDSTAIYRNFKIHSGLTLVARDETGEVHQFTWLRAVAERRGVFKIYSMKD